jgi:hypothetical protein
LAFGGQTPPNTGATEEYDGTSWATNPGSMNTARGYLEGCGTQPAGLAIGGNDGTNLNVTEEYTGAGAPNTVTITAS